MYTGYRHFVLTYSLKTITSGSQWRMKSSDCDGPAGSVGQETMSVVIIFPIFSLNISEGEKQNFKRIKTYRMFKRTLIY